MKTKNTSYPVSNSVAAKLSNLYCNKITAKLMPNVLLDIANRPEIFKSMLGSTTAFSMANVIVKQMKQSELLEYLNVRGIIYNTGSAWEPTDRFCNKNLFRMAKGGKTLQVTFLGECFIFLVVGNPAFDSVEIYNRFFTD
jgi:hypothetical protein